MGKPCHWQCLFVVVVLLPALCLARRGGDDRHDDSGGFPRSCSFDKLEANCSYSVQKDWSFMIFVSTWPGTFCRDGCCRLPSPLSSLPAEFTIHGLWPNYNSTEYPSCCRCQYSHHTVVTMLQGNAKLRSELDTYWPSLKHCKFIHYEFEKHGSCATSLYDGPTGPLDYWTAAVSLRKRYDILKILESAGIKQSSVDSPRYYDPLNEVVPALEKAVGAKVGMNCEEGMIVEVKLCVARDEQNKLSPRLIDCPSFVRNADLSSCRYRKGVMLPSFPALEKPGCL